MGETSDPLETVPPRADRVERVPLGWRWINDAFEVSPIVGGFGMLLADMTNAKAALRILRNGKVPATMTHLIVRAAALALARNPACHRIVGNYRRVFPANVDIGLSMVGQTTYAPVVVLPAADRKPLSVLVPEIIAAVDVAAEKEIRDLEQMRRQFWLIPFGFMRKFILRMLQKSIWFRRKVAGTFQVSTVPGVDAFGSLLFYASCGLTTGSVRDRVIAVDGQAVVRPTMWLTLAGDHAAMDGVSGATLIVAIKDALEGDDLVREAREACEERRARTHGAPAAAELPAANLPERARSLRLAATNAPLERDDDRT
jgi:pyruvate/2-oxoglutarate dehydrogenase complex dihydrolipoamide acyltransferase (E2) component